MKQLFQLIFLAVFISVAWGWPAIELADNSLDHPGYCYGTAENVGAMEKGESKTLKGECVQANCGDDTSIDYYLCGASIAPPTTCNLSEADMTKPYPGCCPSVICP